LRNGEIVHLTLKVFQLLLALVERSGQVMEKETLMERVWPDTAVEEANLKNSISTLRKILGDERGAETYIQTLPKRGYRFIAPVIALPDEDDIYLVEKRMTAEIVVGEVGVATARDETHIVGQQSEKIITSEARPVEDAISLSKKRKAMIAFSSVAAAGLLVGLYMWIGAGGATPAFSFDRMRMSLLPNVGRDGAIISPDGKYLAYVISGTSTDGLWVRQTATDSAIRLLPDVNYRGITFSRDSNFVYCLFLDDKRPEGALYRVPVLGGTAKLVVERIGGDPSFSPDGKRMVFKRGVRKPSLLTANPDGSDERIILPSNSRYTLWRYAWSPDGKTIAMIVRNDAVETQVTWQIIEIPAGGGEERAITEPTEGFIPHITWLPDGSGLVMTRADKTGQQQQLWHLAYPSGIATRITNDSSKYTDTTITADGETILAKRITNAQSLWTGEADDLINARKLTADDESYDYLSWTPDGRILYNDGDSDKSDLWIISADGSHRERLTTDQRQNSAPSISADGRSIVFTSSRSGSHQIWRIDGEGRNPKQLTDWRRGCERAKITPDGQWVFYTAWEPPRLVLKKMSIDGGEAVTIAEKARSFAISPDGKLLAFVSIDEEKKNRAITIKPLAGGEPIRVINHPVFMIEQWTENGLLCISDDRAQILLVPTDGSPTREYFQSTDRIFSCALAPDGRRMAFSCGSFGLETVRITNIKER
jgi:Tol biopolymer transport system component/DNA-binding winged helix-turn-helix (wHTH) protein